MAATAYDDDSEAYDDEGDSGLRQRQTTAHSTTTTAAAYTNDGSVDNDETLDQVQCQHRTSSPSS